MKKLLSTSEGQVVFEKICFAAAAVLYLLLFSGKI